MKIENILTQLETAQLVRRFSEEEATYIFMNALTQDAAYAAILKKTRRDIHLQVAQTLELRYAERLDEFAALLAQHYAAAEHDAKTLEYAARAGDWAARVYANAEAVAHFTRAIEIARASADNMRIRYLYSRRGRELELASQFPAALANYAEMEELARTRGDRTLVLSALVAQCQIRCTANSEFNPSLGEPLAEKALLLARETTDRAAESKILWILVNLYRFTNRWVHACEAGEASLAIARELNLVEQTAFTLNDLSHAYGFSGNFNRARELIQEATLRWREQGNLPMLADSLATTSLYDTFNGEWDEALALSDEASRISQDIGNLWGQTYSLSMVGAVYWARGESTRAIDVMEETLRLSAQSGYSLPQLITRADLGIALASLGAFERGLEHARGALEFADAHYAGVRPYAQSTLVQIFLWMKDLAQAAATFDLFPSNADHISPLFSFYGLLANVRLTFAQGEYAATLDASVRLLRQLEESSLRASIPESLFYKGLAEHALGRPEQARASLLRARDGAVALQARWLLWQIFGALGEIELAIGETSRAQSFFAESRKLVVDIAERAPAELRASFLNLPSVRKLEVRHVAK
ncbi:MAG: tetratricopeptide repeat protein [Chloroflexi bacterium]|nr:tetratricopeptide repeat protein [Chloroflexota bacterium]